MACRCPSSLLAPSGSCECWARILQTEARRRGAHVQSNSLHLIPAVCDHAARRLAIAPQEANLRKARLPLRRVAVQVRVREYTYKSTAANMDLSYKYILSGLANLSRLALRAVCDGPRVMRGMGNWPLRRLQVSRRPEYGRHTGMAVVEEIDGRVARVRGGVPPR
jgi:hypothetical protein